MTLCFPQPQKHTTPKVNIFGILNKNGSGKGSLSLFGSPTNIWAAQPQLMSQITKESWVLKCRLPQELQSKLWAPEPLQVSPQKSGVPNLYEAQGGI